MIISRAVPILGLGKERAHILSAICLVIIALFYFFVVGSVFQIKVYTFQHRVSYDDTFQRHIISLEIDTLILLLATIGWFYLCLKTGYEKAALVVFFSVYVVMLSLNIRTPALVGAGFTLPVIGSLIIIDRLRHIRLLYYDARLTASYITLAAIILASAGTVSLIMTAITGATTVTVEKYSYAIYHQLFSIIAPVILAALIFCVPLKVLLDQLLSKMKVKINSVLLDIVEFTISNRRVGVYLSFSIILGVAIVFMPHLQIINPTNERLGVDSTLYADWLKLMNNQPEGPVASAFKNITSGDRPLSLILLFSIVHVTKQDPIQVVEYTPLIWAPLLVLVTFILTREITSNDQISIIASFLSAISFQTLIGIYAGFYANWFALILAYLGLAVLVKCLKHPSKLKLMALGLLMTSVLLAHVHTWTVIISVAFVFLFALHILNYYPRKHLLLLYLVLSSSIAVDILKSSLTGTSIGLEADISIGLGHGFSVSQFSQRLTTLAETVQTYYGGIYANITMLGLVMYWLVRCKARALVNVFVLIFLSSALIPLFLGDWVLQSRVLYDIPFQIPAAISLYVIWKENHKMIFIAILLITFYLSFHVLANLGYVPPGDAYYLKG